MGAAIGMSTEDLFNDEDLDYTPASSILVHKQPVGKTSGYWTAWTYAVDFFFLCL